MPGILRGRSSLSVGSVILMSVRWSGPSLAGWSGGSQVSVILAVPVPVEVMAMARAGGADGC